MFTMTCPPEIRKIADRFKDAAGVSYSHLTSFFATSLLGTCNLSNTVRYNPWVHSVSALDRALLKFDGEKFMARMRASVLKKFGNTLTDERFCFAVDDTTVQRFGKNIGSISNHPRHGKSGIVRGQRVMVLFLIDKVRGVALPLCFAMCLNKWASGYRSNHDLCFDLVNEIIEAGFPELRTVADSGFDSSALIAKFDSKGLRFIVECKSNRKVRKAPSPKCPKISWAEAVEKEIRRGFKLDPTEQSKRKRKTKYIASRFVQISGRDAPVTAGVVYNKMTDSNFFAVYISNDRTLRGEDLWMHSRARWHVEEAFRALKQSFCFLKLPCQGAGACLVSVCIPFALLNAIQMDPDYWGSQGKYTVGALIRKFRERSLWNAVQKLAGGQKSIAVLTLKTRSTRSSIVKKPSNPSADEIRSYFLQVA
jgi:Transposase DDE domain